MMITPRLWLAAFAASLAAHFALAQFFKEDAASTPSVAVSTSVPMVMRATALEDVETVATQAVEPSAVPEADAAPVADEPDAAAGVETPAVEAAVVADAPSPQPAEPADAPQAPVAEAVTPSPPAAESAAVVAAVADAPAPQDVEPAPAEAPQELAAVEAVAAPVETAALEAMPAAPAEAPLSQQAEPATPEVASPEVSAIAPEATADAPSVALARPEDPTIPFPAVRPPPGARIAAVAPEDADKLERMPVPAMHPTPAAERAAAYRAWQAAEAQRLAAAEAEAARRREEAEEARRTASAAPSGGGGSRTGARSSGQAEAAYAQAVRSRVADNFTRATRRMRGAGTARVTITVARNGRVANVRLAARSGNRAIDNAALNAASRARLPAFGGDIARDSLVFNLPLTLR